MHTAPFDYHRPATLAEALDLLGSVPGARPLSGGHSLLPAMKLRVANPEALVDLAGVSELRGISAEDGGVTIGAYTTHAAVAGSEIVHDVVPVLAETASHIGDEQVRNRGTIGGSLAHADPAADYPTVIVALGATINVTGAGGDRAIPASEFFVDLFETALQPGELITSVAVPGTGSTGGAYVKHRHPASSYAVVGAAALVDLDGSHVSAASIAIGGVAGTVQTVDGASLVGSPIDDEALAGLASQVETAIANPIGDIYASGEYRAHLAGVLATRAVTAAAAKAG